MSAIIDDNDETESTESETSSERFATQLAMVAFRWLPAQRAYRSRQAASRVWMSHSELPEPPSVRA
jgi:hypothetical protein